jgi:hypothetical protein
MQCLTEPSWLPKDFLPTFNKSVKHWQSSSVYEALVQGAYDPEIDADAVTVKDPYPGWDFNEFVVSSAMFQTCIEDFTGFAIGKWNIPANFYWPDEEVI